MHRRRGRLADFPKRSESLCVVPPGAAYCAARVPMFASFLTTILFSLSVIFAARSARMLGGARANLARISIATVLLALWAHGWGEGLHGASLPWFFLSGVIGFGLGDLALFGALPRIGPRLAILLTQCLAAPIAALAEWAWLGTRLQPADVACAGVILVGVAVALAPDRGLGVDRRTFWIGVLCGFGSALDAPGPHGPRRSRAPTRPPPAARRARTHCGD